MRIFEGSIKNCLKSTYLHIVFFILLTFVLSPVSIAGNISLDFKDTDIKDVLRAMAAQESVSIIADPSISGEVTLHLDNIPFETALRTILETNGYTYVQTEPGVFRVGKVENLLPPLSISYKDNLLSLSANRVDIKRLISEITKATGVNIVYTASSDRPVSITLTNLPIETAIDAVAKSAVLNYEKRGGVYYLSPGEEGLTIEYENGLFTANAKNVDIRQLFRELSAKAGITVSLDPAVSGRISLLIHRLPAEEALNAACSSAGLKAIKMDSYYRVVRSSSTGFIRYENGLLSLDLKDLSISEFVSEISNLTGMNFIIDSGAATSRVSGSLSNVPFDQGLKSILDANSLYTEKQREIHVIKRVQPNQNYRLNIDENDLISLEVTNTDFSVIAKDLSERLGKSIIIYSYARAAVNNVVADSLTFEEALGLLLKGTPYTYKKIGSVYYIGDGMTPRIDSLELQEYRMIDLKYISTDLLVASLPPSFPSSNLRVVKERNAVIIIGTNEFIRRAAEWISSIDTPDQALVTEVVKLKYVKALEVQQILAKAYPPQFVSPLQDEYSLVITAPRSIADTLKEQIGKIDIPPVTMPSALIKMKHLQAEEVIKILPASLKKYDIVLVKEQNGIMVTGPSDFIAAIKDYVAEIDLPNPLILFDILVVEYTERDSQKLGMSMGFKEGSTGIGFDFADEKALEPLWINVNPFASLDKEFNITLNTMIQNGSAKIKANPRISTLNGYEANFNVVTKSYYWDPSVNQDNNGSTTGQQQSLNDTLPSGAIRTIDTGVKIRLKPWVSASGDITIDIQPEISDSTGSGSDSGSLPQANERSARTTVRVKDGETIVIGGLIQSIKREEKRKVPILGDLPLIGSLFRSTSIVESESEFVIYITPHLIQDSGANPYMITPDTTTPGNPDDGTSIPALSGNDAEAKEDQVVK